ncbi:hypothetical protein XENOCAPTIV_004421, partial [Xenoophorus captivus]
GYYRRTAEYFPTRYRHRHGCFPVPMVHSTLLLDLRKEGMRKLAFYPPHEDYSWPYDDIIVFAFSCRAAGVRFENYSLLRPSFKRHTFSWRTFPRGKHPRMYVCNKERYGYLNVPAKPHFTLEDDRLNFVHVHLESLSKKRSIRLALNSSNIKLLGVDLLPGYYDPFSGRTLTKGEVVDIQMDKALIFEDDVRFEANFKRRFLRLMEEVEKVELDWDIM